MESLSLLYLRLYNCMFIMLVLPCQGLDRHRLWGASGCRARSSPRLPSAARPSPQHQSEHGSALSYVYFNLL